MKCFKSQNVRYQAQGLYWIDLLLLARGLGANAFGLVSLNSTISYPLENGSFLKNKHTSKKVKKSIKELISLRRYKEHKTYIYLPLHSGPEWNRFFSENKKILKFVQIVKNQTIFISTYSPLPNCRSTTAIYFKLSEPPLRSY